MAASKKTAGKKTVKKTVAKKAASKKTATKKTATKKIATTSTTLGGNSGSPLIDAKIASLPDWRGAALARMRKLIREACPDVIEDVKWRKPTNPAGVPVWEQAGLICTGETYKDKVKLTFAKGASLLDPDGVFNSSLDGNARRAIDIHEGETVDAAAFKALVKAAVALNGSKRAG